MRYLTVNEALETYSRVMQQTGGAIGIHDLGALESAVAQPRMTFGGEELYPTIVEKASALGFSLIQNHPFVDGNKRTGHAAMEMFLVRIGTDSVPFAFISTTMNCVSAISASPSTRQT